MTRTHFFTRTHFLATTALAASLLAAGLAPASAQTFTVAGSVTGGPATFTYSYVLTPTAGTLGLIVFNFSDTNVTAGPTPAGFTASATPPNGGLFSFFSFPGAATATTFTFTSPDGSFGTLGAANATFAGSGVAAVNGITPAPGVVPEPSQTAALGLGVLGLAGLAFKARKRQSA